MANFVYFIGDPSTKEVVLVDPAWQIDTLLKIAQEEGLKISGALITHGHFDHCNGIEELLTHLNIPIYANKEEVAFVRSLGKQKSIFGSFPEENLKRVSSGDKINVGAVEITFIHTPGHTPGSQCFLIKNNLVSGDTLFIRGCGRSDLAGGNPKDLYESLTQKIYKLPDQTILFPGHNYAEKPSSDLKEEKEKNPYLLCSSLETFLNLVQ